MRPVVKTALRRLWRDQTTLQIGVRPERALLLRDVGERAAQLIAAIDGTRDQASLRATAEGLGLPSGFSDRLVTVLVQAGVVDDAGADPRALARLTVAERDRLGPDLSSMSLLSSAADGGVASLQLRRQARVAVIGAGRVGASVAALLAAAGVGHVVVDDPEPCALADCAPGGASLARVGMSRAAAAHAAIDRASTSTRSTPFEPHERPTLVILAPPRGGPDPHVGDALLRADTAHLLVGVREATGVVGPLVIPGESACLRCLDLHRADRDHGWPLIAAQLAAEPSRAPAAACDVALASLAASVTVLQALAFLDRDPGTATRLPATVDGTLEINLPEWRLRRRPWSPHPTCGCHWRQDQATDSAAG